MSCLRMNLSITLASLLLGVLVTSAQSQDRGDRGSRGDWGGRRDRGERGDRGFGGDFNGRPSGDFGGGGRFGGGDFGGGPPGGFGGPPGGFGGGGFGGGRSMMDTNGNGTIEQEELDRMPSFVRDMMKSRGVELKAGMSVDDMRSSMRAGFSGGRDNNGSSGGQDNGNNTNSSPVPAKPVLKPYVMKPKPALIATLPPAYSEVDTNFDGQLGLDEWMLSRRTDLNQFDEFDIDHDGFLIPDELKVAEVAATGTNAAMSVRTEKLTIVSATPKKSSSTAADNGEAQSNSGSGRWSRGGDMTEQAKSYFTRLDQNQDGTIDKDEFQESRRVRGMFERAGIQPAAGMTLEEFTQALQKAASTEQSGGGN